MTFDQISPILLIIIWLASQGIFLMKFKGRKILVKLLPTIIFIGLIIIWLILLWIAGKIDITGG